MNRGSIFILAFTSGLLAGCADRSEPAAVEAPRHEFLNHDPAVSYVGQDACRRCHIDKTTSYRRTGMGRSFAPLEQGTVRADFVEDNLFVDEATGLHYRMFERDGDYYQRQFLVDSRGGELAAAEYRMDHVVGSNHHNRTYLVEHEGKLFQGPVCWFPEEGLWDFCPGFEFKNDDYHREISASCMFCHNDVMPLEAGERNEFVKPYPHGIGCERCHGPGELHVEKWTGSEQVATGEADPSIVHPRRLTPQRRLEVCAQCHLGDAAASERVIRHESPVENYRPGQSLDDTMVAFRYVDQTRFDFGLSAQVDRMVLSPCFRESEGRLECLTCHDPHVSVYSPDRPDDYFTQKCLTCHATEDCGEEHGARGATSPADDCVACHMRTAEPDDLRHSRFTDHWIRRDISIAQPDHRESWEIEPVFPESFDALPPADRAYYRARAHLLMASDAPAEPRVEMWERAEAGFAEAIEAGFDVADAWFFLARVRSNLGKHDEAIAALEAALERDPAHHDANFALGQAVGSTGQGERAAGIFAAMIERDPEDAMALGEYARTLFSLGRVEEALEAYRRAVDAEPWNPTLRLNLGMMLAATGRFDEAADAGLEAARRDPGSAEVWELYFNAAREAGRGDESAEARRQWARLTGR